VFIFQIAPRSAKNDIENCIATRVVIYLCFKNLAPEVRSLQILVKEILRTVYII
jgi:hypothetical protein